MRLRHIQHYDTANDFLEQFLTNEYSRFKVLPENPATAFKPLPIGLDLREIFCLKEYRMVKRDHTFSWGNEIFSITSHLKHSIYKQKLEIRTYQDLTWKVFFAGKEISFAAAKNAEKAPNLALVQSGDLKVRLDGHVTIQGCYYSVSEEFIGKLVAAREIDGQIQIFYGEGMIETHKKITLRDQIASTKPAHLGPWKRCLEPDSFYRKSARRFGRNVENVVVEIIKAGNGIIDTGSIFGILGFDKKYSPKAINDAAGCALEVGLPNYGTIKSILKLHDTSLTVTAKK
jgi:hypothetical protein